MKKRTAFTIICLSLIFILLLAPVSAGWFADFWDKITGKVTENSWTPWYDRDNPSGTGDYEDLATHKQLHPEICDNPTQIECKTISGDDYTTTGQTVVCNINYGFYCRNVDNPGDYCLDYKVRFYCGAGEPEEECIDSDGDGYGSPASSACTYPKLDCDDTDASIYPGATEVCGDNIDQDCDGSDLVCDILTCTDSDVTFEYPDGNNIYTKGTCTDNSGSYDDSCEDSSMINEKVCSNNQCVTNMQGCSLGYVCSNGVCAIDTTTPVCGNNLVEIGETCDDGNTISGDGCSSNCETELVVELINATISLATLKDIYNINEQINLTDPPEENDKKITGFAIEEQQDGQIYYQTNRLTSSEEFIFDNYVTSDLIQRRDIITTEGDFISQPKFKGYIIEFEDVPIIAKKTELEKIADENKDLVLAKAPVTEWFFLTPEEVPRHMESYSRDLKRNHENIKLDIISEVSNVRQSRITTQAISPQQDTTANVLNEYTKTFNGIALDITDAEARDIEDISGVKKVYPNYLVNITLMDSVPLINADDVWSLGYRGGAVGEQQCMGTIDCTKFSSTNCPTDLNCIKREDCIGSIDTDDFCSSLDSMLRPYGWENCNDWDRFEDGFCDWGPNEAATACAEASGEACVWGRGPSGYDICKPSPNTPSFVNCNDIYISRGFINRDYAGCGTACNCYETHRIWSSCQFERSCIQNPSLAPYNCLNFDNDGTNCLEFENYGCSYKEVKTVTIAIIDTGIDYTHEDLGGCLGQDCKVIGGYDFVNEDNNPMDDHGHGTHVAATAAGNGVLKGVAPGANLIAYKVLNQDGYGYDDGIIAAIERAVDPNQDGDFLDHYDVISLSLGYFGGTPDDPSPMAIDNAVDVGVVAVIAAGNSGSNYGTIGSPGTSRRAITVGASNKQDLIAYFSSRGPVEWEDEQGEKKYLIKPDVVAPGVDICAAQWDNWLDDRQCLDDSHIAISGTSMATPHVAGAVALLKQKNPDWTPEEIKMALRNTAVDIYYDILTQGYGKIDVLNLIQLENAPPVGILTTSGELKGIVDLIGEIQTDNFQSYSVYYGTERNPIYWVELFNSDIFPENDILFSNWDTTLLQDGESLLKLEITNGNGDIGEDNTLIEINNVEIVDPVQGGVLRAGDNLEITGIALGGTNFQNYKLYYGLGESPDEWIQIGDVHETQVEEGLLGIWDTSNINSAGYYTIKLSIDNLEFINEEEITIYLDPTIKEGFPIRINEIYIESFDGYFYPRVSDTVVSDLDLDGSFEIIFATGEEFRKTIVLNVLNEDGSNFNNWPIEIPNYRGNGISLAVGDIDNDGDKEILLVNPLRNNSLYGFNHDGSAVEGFPIELPYTPVGGGSDHSWYTFSASIILSDLNKDGNLEIIVYGKDPGYLAVYNNRGIMIPNYPIFLPFGNGISSNLPYHPSVGNFDEDEDLEIVLIINKYYSGEINPKESSIEIFNYDGSRVPGWPFLMMDYLLWNAPAVGDIDNDGETELVVAYEKGVYVLDKNGEVKSGWPQLEEKRFSASPILTDFENDGFLEIIIGEYGGDSTYALDHNGNSLNGWPQQKPYQGFYYPVSFTSSASVNSLQDNLIFDVAGRLLYGWDSRGNILEGFPKIGEAMTTSEISIGDIDGDGMLEIVTKWRRDRRFIDLSGWLPWIEIVVWETDIEGSYILSWPKFQHDIQNTGCYDCVSEIIPQPTRPQSKIVNNEDIEVSGNLKMILQRELQSPQEWVDEQIIIDKEVTIPAGGLIKLDYEWNPQNVVVSEAGNYRVYAALLDSEGNVIETIDGLLETSWEFEVI